MKCNSRACVSQNTGAGPQQKNKSVTILSFFFFYVKCKKNILLFEVFKIACIYISKEHAICS